MLRINDAISLLINVSYLPVKRLVLRSLFLCLHLNLPFLFKSMRSVLLVPPLPPNELVNIRRHVAFPSLGGWRG